MAEIAQAMDHNVNAGENHEGKYLTFSLAGEEYGISILKVKEIIGMMSVTPVPQTPEYFKGVINLRGKVIPVVDLRLKFGMASLAYTERTCIIVVEIRTPVFLSGQAREQVLAFVDRKISMGIVVDAVSEVLSIKGADIEETPCFGTGPNTAYILGMAKSAQGVKILLDIDKVMNEEEVDHLEAVM